MNELDPKRISESFASLDSDHRNLFLQMLAVKLPQEEILFLLAKMDTETTLVFHEQFYRAITGMFLPILLKEARRLARGDLSNVSDEEFDKKFGEQISASIYSLIRTIFKRAEERFRKKRDRKSDPETITRNVEICELRKQDRKRWKLATLAKKFDVTIRYIGKVIQGEAKWRSLAAKLGNQ